jgi:hypothetical protein
VLAYKKGTEQNATTNTQHNRNQTELSKYSLNFDENILDVSDLLISQGMAFQIRGAKLEKDLVPDCRFALETPRSSLLEERSVR